MSPMTLAPGPIGPGAILGPATPGQWARRQAPWAGERPGWISASPLDHDPPIGDEDAGMNDACGIDTWAESIARR